MGCKQHESIMLTTHVFALVSTRVTAADPLCHMQILTKLAQPPPSPSSQNHMGFHIELCHLFIPLNPSPSITCAVRPSAASSPRTAGVAASSPLNRFRPINIRAVRPISRLDALAISEALEV